ncbi:MAG: IclR family transcriptional regulator [Candidatus Rokubacteria bacterium]|nr:IclR family transcriptional regulator [Candidatus Rokubacteria bacterium]
MTKKAKSEYLIQAVSRALDLLEAFSTKEGALGVTDLARKLKLHKNNVFRLLATLETRGYVEQEKESERYRLGVKVYELAAVFLHHLDLRRQSRPHLEALAAKTGETAYLAVLDRASAVYVDMVESDQSVRVAPRLGRRFPAVASAAGQVLLAALQREQREAALAGQAEAARILERLAGVAAQGYAIDSEESEPGIVAVAAPIRDLTKRVVGAVECGAPSFRWTPERLTGELAPLVTGTAQQVEAALGVEPHAS